MRVLSKMTIVDFETAEEFTRAAELHKLLLTNTPTAALPRKRNKSVAKSVVAEVTETFE
jgi:hypothetical protein